MAFRLGYVIPEFPSQTHAFFWREAAGLEAGGAFVRFVSTKRPPEDACPHAFAEEARRRTRYLFPPSPSALSAARQLTPRTLARLAAYVAGLAESNARERAKVLALVPSALELVSIVESDRLDHVHVHSCADAAHLAAVANIICGVPFSLTLHGDLPVYGKDHGRKFSRASMVSAVTRPLAEQIREVSATVPTPVVWMGVDTDRFRPRDRFDDSTSDPLRVVTVARLNLVKGHHFFLEAMARLTREGHDIRYEIAGSGPYQKEIQREIAALGLSDRATMLGAISEHAVAELLSRADVFALTSYGLGEAAPVAIMEAMACGVPAICSLIGGTGDMIVSGEDGILVEQRNVDDIERALRALLSRERRAEMSRRARQSAVEKFDYRSTASDLLDHMKLHSRRR